MRSGQLPLRLDRNELSTSLNGALPSLYSLAPNLWSGRDAPHVKELSALPKDRTNSAAGIATCS